MPVGGIPKHTRDAEARVVLDRLMTHKAALATKDVEFVTSLHTQKRPLSDKQASYVLGDDKGLAPNSRPALATRYKNFVGDMPHVKPKEAKKAKRQATGIPLALRTIWSNAEKLSAWLTERFNEHAGVLEVAETDELFVIARARYFELTTPGEIVDPEPEADQSVNKMMPDFPYVDPKALEIDPLQPKTMWSSDTDSKPMSIEDLKKWSDQIVSNTGGSKDYTLAPLVKPPRRARRS